MNDEVAHARDHVRASGHRWTAQRETIARTLIAAPHPTSAEALFDTLADDRCDLVTVYRILATFENLALVRRQFQRNGTAAFEWLRPEMPHWIASRDGDRWEKLSKEESAILRKAESKIVELLTQRGVSDVTPLVQFFAGR